MLPDYISAYKPDILSVSASQSSQIHFMKRELSYGKVSDLKVAAFSCQVDDLVVRSDPVSFSMPYSQIADLNLTLCFLYSQLSCM